MIATTRYAQTPLSPPTPRVLPAARARLCLLPAGTRSGRLDGAWWPRSRQLARELPALIAAADPRFGRIDRITVNASRWPRPPRRIAVPGRTIHVGRFPTAVRPVEVCVLSNNAGRWDLLVVPPESEFGEAEISSAVAAGAFDRSAAEAWLARAEADLTAAEAVWDAEGGQGAEQVLTS